MPRSLVTLEQLLIETRDLIEVMQSSQLSQQPTIGDPESASVGMISETLIPANGARLVLIGNESQQPAYLAIDRTAIPGKGILLSAGDTRIVPLGDGLVLNAISTVGGVDVLWQAFSGS